MGKAKTPQTNDSFSKAVACLGAKEVAPERYAVKDKDNGWVILNAAQTEAAYLEPDWCFMFVRMPAWWKPEKRFAWRGPYMVTADLETGAEVPA